LHVLVDLGCGAGGLERRLASTLGARLIGLDFSDAAIAAARAAVGHQQAAERADFHVADFASTGLPEASVSAVVSLDALYLAPDPRVALDEVRRILVPSGGLFFTVYLSSEHYPGTTSLLSDWRLILSSAGFSVDSSQNHSSVWRDITRSKHEGRWASRAALTNAEFGRDVEAELSVSTSMLGLGGRPSFLDQVERFEISAQRMS
jgi:ubiquinone/menaquinone biosynthesis C-methylase UbiE